LLSHSQASVKQEFSVNKQTEADNGADDILAVMLSLILKMGLCCTNAVYVVRTIVDEIIAGGNTVSMCVLLI